MLILTSGRQGMPKMDAGDMVRIFPRMRADFNAIKDVREAYAQIGLNDAIRKRGSGAFRRKLASIPRPIYVWLQTKAPEILANPLLLRQYLRDNPWFLLVDRSTV